MKFDIGQILAGGGIGTALTAIIAWLRFKRKDSAEVEKLNTETYIDLATVLEKKIANESKIADGAVQWNITLVSQLEKANVLIDKLRDDKDRLNETINKMRLEFYNDIQNLEKKYSDRIRELETTLNIEREQNKKEIQILKQQVYGNDNR